MSTDCQKGSSRPLPAPFDIPVVDLYEEAEDLSSLRTRCSSSAAMSRRKSSSRLATAGSGRAVVAVESLPPVWVALAVVGALLFVSSSIGSGARVRALGQDLRRAPGRRSRRVTWRGGRLGFGVEHCRIRSRRLFAAVGLAMLSWRHPITKVFRRLRTTTVPSTVLPSSSAGPANSRPRLRDLFGEAHSLAAAGGRSCHLHPLPSPITASRRGSRSTFWMNRKSQHAWP